MAEHWKSTPRYWCKQCKIFIRDTPFEKTQHEASPKHQGSLKRFLRDIHKNNEIQQRDSQRAKSEVERLRQAVSGGASDSKDTKAASSAPAAKRTAAPAERPVGVEERKKQMAQLAEMGIAIPDEYRGDLSLAGQWQTLSESSLDPEAAAAAKSVGVRKRKLDGDEDEEGEAIPEQYVSKGWGSRMKIYPGAQDDVDEDLDALLASTKDLKKVKMDTPTVDSGEVKSEFELPPKQEDTTGDANTKPTVATASEGDQSTTAKTEELDLSSIPLANDDPESEEAPGVVFKKRKPKVIRK
ncbi:hypothetical protein N7478_002320 [Penicillium angulare]|uniref:uncharacterized protein n=1 Tax=Penicillium angulare TaxID=116970 RepID=UPI00253FB446|nr:uncharacterized protein N7478_002320 [Penicillium angulare]KAJ5286634.1 hypothetical protein N7478_002320 [Penicillium angulare]